MKKRILCLILCASTFALEAGARGGKLVDVGTGFAEILIQEDGVISIGFYDASKKQIDPLTQSVSVVAQTKEGKANLKFKKADKFLVSTPLPKGEDYQIVVQIKDTPERRPHNTRIKYDMHICGECSHPEYACTCEH